MFRHSFWDRLYPSPQTASGANATGKRRRVWQSAAALCGLAVLVSGGCGKSGPERLPVFPVSGQVLYKDKPLPNAQITLHPKNADPKALPAQAQTDQNGNFQVTTYEAGDGAAFGEYVVTVKCYQLIKNGDSYERGPNILPPKLANAQSTDWKIQVAEAPNSLPPKKIAR